MSHISVAELVSALDRGYSVQISTALRSILVSPAMYAAWAKKGLTLFRENSAGSVFIARGKRWDCIDYTDIKYLKEVTQ